MGGAAGTRHQYRALLPVTERVLSAERPHTLTTRANPAYWAEVCEKSRSQPEGSGS